MIWSSRLRCLLWSSTMLLKMPLSYSSPHNTRMHSIMQADTSQSLVRSNIGVFCQGSSIVTYQIVEVLKLPIILSRCFSIILHFLCPNKPVKQSPSQDKAHATSKHISCPQLRQWPLEILLLLPLGQQCPNQYRHKESPQEVKGKAGIRLETKNTRGNTEKRGC